METKMNVCVCVCPLYVLATADVFRRHVHGDSGWWKSQGVSRLAFTCPFFALSPRINVGAEIHSAACHLHPEE